MKAQKTNWISNFRNFHYLLMLIFCGIFSHTVFAADGDLDPNFNVAVRSGGGTGGVNTVVAGADGKVYIAGDFDQINGTAARNGLARFNADGTVDTGFVPANDNNSSASGLAVQPDGKVITNTNVGGAGKIARFNSDGSLDSSFTPITVSGFISSFALQADGKILVAGTVSSVGGTARTGFFRLNSNGSLDSSFNPTFVNSNGGVNGYAVAAQPDGKIIVGGLFTQVNGTNHRNIARLNSDGTTDASFGTGIGIGQDTTNSNADVRDLSLTADGKIYIGGNFGFYDGVARNRLARLNANGSLDASFAPNIPALGSRSVTSVFAQPDNKLLVGGSFTVTVGGASRNSIFRLNADGSFDATFAAVGTNSGGSVSDITMQADGKILVGGFFSSFNGNAARLSLARLLNTAINAPTPAPPQRRISDFDGDGKSDVSVARAINGLCVWYIRRSSDNQVYSIQWGLATDRILPLDYDGDGRADLAVVRLQNGQLVFYILLSSTNTARIFQFGLAGDDITVSGDWDGDGKADPAVYRAGQNGGQSYFYYLGSLNNPNGNITYLPWGIAGDASARGDFDGDGRQDLAIFRPSNQTWYIRQSSNGQILYQQFGLFDDRRIFGDFDGDGKTDIAVFRPSNGFWYVLQSSNNQVRYVQFGVSSDVPVPADYDGDGKTDFAVWRPGEALYYILPSLNSQVGYQNFGAPDDTPTASVFVR